jgi:hypothetical protein
VKGKGRDPLWNYMPLRYVDDSTAQRLCLKTSRRRRDLIALIAGFRGGGRIEMLGQPSAYR